MPPRRTPRKKPASKQRFPERAGKDWTGPLVDYVKRGRDAGLSLIFATQQPSAVNSKLMSQVDINGGNRIAGRSYASTRSRGG